MNKKIIIAAVVITAAGITKAWVNKQPVTRVILGSYIFVLVLSVLDMFGGSLASLAGALAMVAATFVVLHEFPWQAIGSALNINLVENAGSQHA